MRRSLVLALLVLAAPTALAQVSLDLVYEDAKGDIDAASADVLRFSSALVDGTTLQMRVDMAARPSAPEDTIIVRAWYRDSHNGSFHVIDLEVHGEPGFVGERFRAVRREGDFYNVSSVAATYGVENGTWVFDLDAGVLAGATCFDPLVWSQHFEGSGAPEVDQAFLAKRACRTRGDPPLPVPQSIRGSIPPSTPEPAIEAPGSRAPAPGLGAPMLLAGLALAAMLVGRSGR